MRLARWIFLIAGIYGVLVLLPGFFVELAGRPQAQPEFYYGFLALALVWQQVFFAIARDPAGLRWLMPVAVLEKAAFFAPSVALHIAGRLAVSGPFIGAMIDGVWMVLFAVAWRATRQAPVGQT
jgi:hypothetical protein